jgi:ubiquinone/menaquinone biosynthesis C-methylase UbiE
VEIREAYDLWSGSYDSVENPTRDLDRAATSETLGGMRFEHILELGCGTGKNTEFLSGIGARVHAIDFSQGMLSIARDKVTADNVTFSVADVNSPWPQADQSVDLVCCNLILEHVADLRFIFGEARRCLTPGGKLFVSELHPAKQYVGKRAAFCHGDTRTEISAHVHHISDFFSAAGAHDLKLLQFKEWWHQPDRNSPPLLVSFLYEG